MRRHLKLKSLFLLLALMTSLIPPIPGIGSAEAQVRSGGRNVSHQNARGSRQGSVHRSHRGSGSHVDRGRVNRGQVHRSHPNRSHVYRSHRSRPVVRHTYRPGRVVVHPRRYWNRGGAIAAGAAIGFIAGAAAVSWAGQPPRAGYCWYYTTPARTTGFWDWCPVR